MLELQCSKAMFLECLDNLEIKNEDKELLKDKYIKRLSVRDLSKKYFLSIPNIYYRLNKLRGEFNKQHYNLKDNIRI